MEDRYNGEILLIEDESDFLEQSLNMLMSSENTQIRISLDNETGISMESLEKGINDLGAFAGRSFALLYSWPRSPLEEEQELLEINPDLRIIPLFLISGPKKEMDSLTHGFSGTINCFKLSVDLARFLENVSKTPVFWGLIDTPSETANENDGYTSI